ncbi:MAG: hypothetical protein M3008_09875, partial [Chloroflexota bacterium]|nr:hypothetical protein [Chloroflexota bacterium]
IGILFLLGIAGLAASGTTVLLARIATWRFSRIHVRRAVPVAFSVVLMVGFGAEYATRPLAVVPLESGESIPPVYQWLANQPNARVIELPLAIPDHEYAQSIAVREQYFSLVHHHPIVNGNANVLPKGYRSLVLDMKHFPSERTVSLLQGLGITHVVVHFDQYPRTKRAELAAQLTSKPDGLLPSAHFGETAVYTITQSSKLVELSAIVSPGASVHLSRNDPTGTGAYMAMLGYVLRDHPLYANFHVNFGKDYEDAHYNAMPYDYAILFPHEDPAQVGFSNAGIVWQDTVVRVYRRP